MKIIGKNEADIIRFLTDADSRQLPLYLPESLITAVEKHLSDNPTRYKSRNDFFKTAIVEKIIKGES